MSATAAAGPGARAAAAALAVEVAGLEGAGGTAILLDLCGEAPRSGLLASEAARGTAAALASEPTLRAVPRGHLVLATVRGSDSEEAVGVSERAAEQVGAPLVVCAPGPDFTTVRDLLAAPAGCLVQAGATDSTALLSLLADEHRRLGIRLLVWRRAPGVLPARRALAGLRAGGEAGRRAARTAAAFGRSSRARAGAGASGCAVRRPLEAGGQALPLALGLVALALAFGLVVAAIGAGATAKGRAQRAVDLAALSAARSMAEDFPRLFVAAGRAGGAHLSRASYLRRARAVAAEAARRNGIPERSLRVRFPDGASFAPLRVAVRADLEVRAGGSDGRTRVRATAALEPGAGNPAGAPSHGAGGGYSGPLEYRQGKPMRPDVAAAFDRLARAASRAGHAITITSAYRSDAEQARLFAANPDPRWVAPPGTSLHRCGTELDLGPPASYGWLAANADRFGFLKRYPHEPWHFGYVRGPEPCSRAPGRAANSRRRGDGRRAGGGGLPAFVPARYRQPLLRAAARNDVPAALLAAQLAAESNFNPAAVSPAGARGIAQFMPATAAAYGLRDPFDPEQAIAAQGRLMGELLRRFGSTELALAAYNAGPGVVGACSCVPPYPETQAYVARILGMLDGAGELAGAPAPLLVRLVR